MVDESALLGTVATASAALVAIVGGLLVSRVVSLATERSGLLHRRDDLDARMVHAQSRSDELEERLTRWDALELIESHHRELAKLPDEFDIDHMIRRSRIDRTPDEMRPYIEEELERLRAARDALEHLFESGVPDEMLHELDRSGRVAVPPDAWSTWDAMFDQLTHEYSKPTWGPRFDPLAFTDPTVSAVRSVHEESQHDQLRRDAERARHEVDALHVELEQTELALARVSKPTGVVGGVWVLGYFAGVGTLLPLVLMASPKGNLPGWGSWAVIGLFASGVGVLMGYVIRSVRRLSGAQ